MTGLQVFASSFAAPAGERAGGRVFATRRCRSLFAALIAGFGLQCWPARADAATTTATMAVTMTVAANCTMSASDMNFGIYTGAKIDSTATLTVQCTNTTAYQVGADNGQNSVYIGVYAKYMLGPAGNKLRYHLYTDAARSIEWGTTPGTDEIAGTGTGNTQAITFYGTVGAGALGAQPGAYSDTVTLTLTF